MGESPSPMGTFALDHLPADGRGQRLLELGCGSGRDLGRFARRGFSVAAIDLSLAAVRHARARSMRVRRPAGVPRPIVDHGDVAEFLVTQPDGSAAAVYSNLFLTMGFPDATTTGWFREIARVLRPGGRHLFSVRTVDDQWFGRGREVEPRVFDLAPDGPTVRFYDDAELRRRAGPWFDRVAERRTSEGAGAFRRRVIYVVDVRRRA